MDDETIDAYEKNGADFAQRYRSGQRVPVERFRDAFGEQGRILEVGIGSGVDTARLMDAGYDVLGIEPSATFRQEAVEHFPQLSERLFDEALPLSEDARKRWRSCFDGVFCSAVLMHIQEEDQESAVKGIAEVLKPGGHLLLTVSATRDGLDGERRDEFGRLYVELPQERVAELCSLAGMSVLQTWDEGDAWHRRGLLWATYLVEKGRENGNGREK